MLGPKEWAHSDVLQNCTTLCEHFQRGSNKGLQRQVFIMNVALIWTFTDGSGLLNSEDLQLRARIRRSRTTWYSHVDSFLLGCSNVEQAESEVTQKRWSRS